MKRPAFRTCLLLLALVVAAGRLPAQTAGKKALDHADVDAWNTLEDEALSADGTYVAFTVQPRQGDGTVRLVRPDSDESWSFPRGSEPRFSADGQYLVFILSPPFDTLRAMRRRKVEKDSLPPDTLAIYHPESDELVRIPDVEKVTVPEKWPGWIAYERRDTTAGGKKGENDQPIQLVLRELATAEEVELDGVKAYVAAEKAPRFLIHREPADSTLEPGVFLFDGTEKTLRPLLTGKGDHQQLALSESGDRAAFLAHRDTTDQPVPPFDLYTWSSGQAEARLTAAHDADFLPDSWRISEHGDLRFSQDGSSLFFGLAPPPLQEDTTLLEEEIVNVEVWSYTDGRLYTQREVEREADERKTYTAVWHAETGEIVPLADEDLPEIDLGDEGNAEVALGSDPQPYLKQISWAGYPVCADLFIVDLGTGARTPIAEAVCGNARLSPRAGYAYWYSVPDTAWFAYRLADQTLRQLTDNADNPFYDELNDRPDHPSSYGLAGWTAADERALIYDRYDIWSIDPSGREAPRRLTRGRENKTVYRYVPLDPEARNIDPEQPWLLHVTNEVSRDEGYVWYDPRQEAFDPAQEGPFDYSRNVMKARDAERFAFTRESFVQFPDLLYSKDSLRSFTQVSEANPQQDEFNWGSIELHAWTSANGDPLEGLLIKPEDFDPGRQYPTIVYFYERYSDNLHRHWTPDHGRSIINFPFYASRGYVIFIPDIPYQVGYPGKSAYDAVMPGISSLMAEGFVDPDRIGVQGHSWGGYQSAYLISQTDLFACAESGAPVVNMTSAYGGIRWGSGLSRMFQYERTQSRIGGTLWEYPMRYIENSPLFYADQINTPVLILHNDEDGAVPWYQGIEFFVAMRRLGKPAWLLNYNGEPHWPLKYQNRKDFQLRMQQFFDHYLQDGPKPRWMERGVPPLEKGIEQGYEPVQRKVSDTKF